jgi:copper chaperone
MRKAEFKLEPLSCPSCIKKIETALKNQSGVAEAKVLFHSNKVRVLFQDEIVQADALQKVITSLGYPVLSEKVS